MASTPPGFEHRTVSLRDFRCHYVVGGEGEPLILIHGFPTTWYEWRHVMPLLAREYKVFAVDLRGIGDSTRPFSGFDKATLGEDVHQFVTALGLHGVRVVGHDWGASVAYAYARAHRADVVRLAVLEHALPGFGLEENLVATPDRVFWHMTFHMSNVAEALVAGRERVYLSWWYTDIAFNPAAVTSDEVDEYIRTYEQPGAMRSGFNLYRSFFQDADYNRANLEPKLELPVLALGGSHCLGDLTERGFRHVATDVKGAVFEECGHWIPQEKPRELVDALIPFMKS